MNQEQLVKIRLRKIIICSETRTKSHHQPDQRTVDNFQLFLASVHFKTIKSTFYFSSKRTVTKNQKQRISSKVSIKNFYQIHEVEIY